MSGDLLKMAYEAMSHNRRRTLLTIHSLAYIVAFGNQKVTREVTNAA